MFLKAFLSNTEELFFTHSSRSFIYRILIQRTISRAYLNGCFEGGKQQKVRSKRTTTKKKALAKKRKRLRGSLTTDALGSRQICDGKAVLFQRESSKRITVINYITTR